jgi:hypothetical protein
MNPFGDLVPVFPSMSPKVVMGVNDKITGNLKGTLTFASWNQIREWLRGLATIRQGV